MTRGNGELMITWSVKKKIVLAILLGIAVYLAYLIVGMLVPFANLKMVSEAQRKEAQILAEEYFPQEGEASQMETDSAYGSHVQNSHRRGLL